jgi:hypothetical protein
MGINKQTPCQRCKQAAWGKHCRGCSNIVLPTRQRMGHAPINTDFNVGGFASTSGMSFAKVQPTVGPWWIDAPRTGFTQLAEQQHASRMARGVCGNHRAAVEQQAGWNV